jgi:hypothetical protein
MVTVNAARSGRVRLLALRRRIPWICAALGPNGRDQDTVRVLLVCCGRAQRDEDMWAKHVFDAWES